MSNWWDDGPLGTPGSGDHNYQLPHDWNVTESTLYLDVVFDDPIIANDAYLQTLFDAALFDPDIDPEARDDAYAMMVDYMWDEYGIDFDMAFDWEDYRSWYENA